MIIRGKHRTAIHGHPGGQAPHAANTSEACGWTCRGLDCNCNHKGTKTRHQAKALLCKAKHTPIIRKDKGAA